MLLALWIEQVAAVDGPFSADRDVVGILDVNEGQRPNAVGGKVGVDRAAAGIVAVEVGTGVERLVGFEILNAFERGSFFQAQRHVALKEDASAGECAGRDDYRSASALVAFADGTVDGPGVVGATVGNGTESEDGYDDG